MYLFNCTSKYLLYVKQVFYKPINLAVYCFIFIYGALYVTTSLRKFKLCEILTRAIVETTYS